MTKSVFDDVLKEESQWVTLYKRNAGFIAKLNISSRNKILDKMKIPSSQTRTTLILERYVAYGQTTKIEIKQCSTGLRKKKK